MTIQANTIEQKDDKLALIQELELTSDENYNAYTIYRELGYQGTDEKRKQWIEDLKRNITEAVEILSMAERMYIDMKENPVTYDDVDLIANQSKNIEYTKKFIL